MDDQWTFQCEIQKRHPLRDETSTDETTPKPDRPRPHLGRNRVLAYGPVTFPHSGVSRMSASVRLMIQGHSARRASSRVRQCHQLIKISEIKSEPYTIYVEYKGGWCMVRDFSRFQTYSLPRFKLISPLLLKHHDYLSVKTLPQVKISRTTMLKHQRVTT